MKKVVLRLLCGLLCLCLTALGLVAAVQLTLCKESHYFAALEKTDYYQALTDTILVTCENYAREVQLNAGVPARYVTRDLVKQDLCAIADRSFRGLPQQDPPDPFLDLEADLAALLAEDGATDGDASGGDTTTGGAAEGAADADTAAGNGITVHIPGDDNAAAEGTEDAASTDELMDWQQINFSLLHLYSFSSYRQLLSLPFAAVLHLVWPLRGRLWVLAAIVAVFGLAAAWMVRQNAGRRWRGLLLQALLGSALSLGAIAAWLRWGLPYASWMPTTNAEYGAFCRWWAGLPLAVALCGALLLALGAAALLWPRRATAPGAVRVGQAPPPPPVPVEPVVIMPRKATETQETQTQPPEQGIPEPVPPQQT